MTREEFTRLATNPPADTRPSVFILHMFRIADNCEAEYPEFAVDESRTIFPDFESAERRMQELVGTERLYCFQIRQIPMGVETAPDDYSQLRLYSKEGQLLDRSYASTIYADGDGRMFAPFRGRPEEAIRFREGDIIEYLAGDGNVRIGVVLYRPCTVEQLWERMAQNQPVDELPAERVFMDFSDDIYLVIDEQYECWGCDHNVPSTSILPLSMPLPADMRNRLEAKYAWARQGN